METALVIVENDVPLADSREIAKALGIKPVNFRELLQDKQEYVEKHFGPIRFMTEVGYRPQGGGKAQKYALLTEEQSYYALTFCENTDAAMELRAKLIKAFMEAKAQLAQLYFVPSAQIESDDMARWIARCEAEIEQDAAQLAKKRLAVSYLKKGQSLWKGEPSFGKRRIFLAARPVLTLEEKVLAYVKAHQYEIDNDKIPTRRNLMRYLKAQSPFLASCIADLCQSGQLQEKQRGKATYYVLAEQEES